MAQTRALADRVVPGEGLAWDALRILAANVLLILCARVAIPLPWTPVPITGQTFGVMLIAVLLGPTRAALALCIYLIEGAAGLPVFQPFGAPGAARFVGPTAGYLLSYPLAAYVTGWLAARFQDESGKVSTERLLAALAAGQALILLAGTAWLAVFFQRDWGGAFTWGTAPFLAGEVVKIAAVVGVARTLDFVTRSR